MDWQHGRTGPYAAASPRYRRIYTTHGGGVGPRITALVNELLDKAFESDPTDFIAEFAYPLPAIVIAEMLGVPAEERDRFMVWSDALTAYTGTGKPGEGRQRIDEPLSRALSSTSSPVARSYNPRRL